MENIVVDEIMRISSAPADRPQRYGYPGQLVIVNRVEDEEARVKLLIPKNQQRKEPYWVALRHLEKFE